MHHLPSAVWVRSLAFAGLLVLSGITALSAQEAAPFPAPKSLGDVKSYGKNIQRTMRLLETSTPEKRNNVKILFYGQSITEQAWAKQVADDLRKRYPNADLVIENRAIGGHASQLLVKTAEADLYPFQPDLVIFHVYGAHNSYEDILRNIRQRTTAEILQQNDHVNQEADLTEETDAAKLPPKGEHWGAFMNHNWLPSLSKKYSTEFCDQRKLWKTYLKDYDLKPSALLKDGVHLNPRGEYVMAEFVKAHLRHDAALGASPAEGWVKTLTVGKDIQWKDGVLRLEFEGNRVVAICKPGQAAPASVLIDGKKPSETAECYAFTRTSVYPQMNWPCLLRVGSNALRAAEDWTLTLKGISKDGTDFQYSLTGSKTGEDGSGDAKTKFVSKSGRVTFQPDDWNMVFARKVRSNEPPPADGFKVTWKSYLLGTDEFVPPATAKPGVEATVTLVQGLANGKHVLEIRGGDLSSITALRVYSPPLK